MKLKNPFLIVSKKERPFHLAFWILGLILINIPEWDVHMGVFHSDDFSLIIPSIYGTFLNAYLFYECTRQILQSTFTDATDTMIGTLLTLLAVTMLEAFLDAGFYAFYFWDFNQGTFTQIILNEVLMDFIFVYLPSLMYAFIKMWHPQEQVDEERPSLTVRGDSTEITFEIDQLIYVENHGTFSLFHASKQHMLQQSLEESLAQLPEQFLQCHSCYIVNTHQVKALLQNEIVVGGFMLPVEEKYWGNLKKVMASNVLIAEKPDIAMEKSQAAN